MKKTCKQTPGQEETAWSYPWDPGQRGEGTWGLSSCWAQPGSWAQHEGSAPPVGAPGNTSWTWLQRLPPTPQPGLPVQVSKYYALFSRNKTNQDKQKIN